MTYSHFNSSDKVSALEALAQIQTFLTQTNQTIMDSYAKAESRQTILLDSVSKSVRNVSDATTKKVEEYLKQQEAAAHQPLWKTLLKCSAALVTIVVAVVTQQYWLAGALAIYFVMEQLPTGFDKSGKPITVMDRLAEAGMPQWCGTVLNGLLIVGAGVGAAATTGGWAAVAAGTTLLSQTSLVGDLMTQAGVDSSTVMWINMTVGIAGMVVGAAASLKLNSMAQLSTMAKTLILGVQVGGQMVGSATDIATGVIQNKQFSSLEEVARAIGDLKHSSRNLQAELDSLNVMIQQNADGLVQSREDLTQQMIDINRTYNIIGEAVSNIAA